VQRIGASRFALRQIKRQRRLAPIADFSRLGSNMRQRIVIVLALFVPLVVRANPVIINPASLIAFWVVAFMALMVEAGIVALLLAFRGVTPVACFRGVHASESWGVRISVLSGGGARFGAAPHP
jgi:hypothetical protein